MPLFNLKWIDRQIAKVIILEDLAAGTERMKETWYIYIYNLKTSIDYWISRGEIDRDRRYSHYISLFTFQAFI